MIPKTARDSLLQWTILLRVRRTLRRSLFALVALTVVHVVEPAAGQNGGGPPAVAGHIIPLPTDAIGTILGAVGTLKEGQYKVAFPQTDLDVIVDGFDITPSMGTTSWVVFLPTDAGAMIMGDLVLLEDEFGPVEKLLVQGGVRVTAIHNHFLRDTPKVMFLHVGGSGDPLVLSRAVRSGLDEVSRMRRDKGLVRRDHQVVSTLSADSISAILGHVGNWTAGVYKVVIGRPDIDLRVDGIRIGPFAGFNTWMAWQGRPEAAAVSGDFAMLAREVAPVVEALVGSGIEVTAVHNHMAREEPRIFFLHFWGVGPLHALTTGLRAALDAQAGAPSPDLPSGVLRLRFDDGEGGQLPEGWRAEGTNQQGPVATWVVEADPMAPSPPNLLALADAKDGAGGTYNLLWTDRTQFSSGVIEVKVHARAGRGDRGGGPAWRIQDKDDYYVARWNPLEDNFRLYVVARGKRVQLDSASVDADPSAWHTIRIRHVGDVIECSFDGTALLKSEDRTIRAAGGVGLWTKADAASSFDDLIVSPAAP